MHIRITPQVIKHFNCMDYYCRNIAELANRSYEMIFLDQWDFDFDENCSALGNGIYFYGRNYPITDEKNYKLMHYHGINIQYYYTSLSEEVIYNIYDELKYNHPLLVRFDGLIMDWGDEIEKTIRRYRQMFLVVGIDDDYVYYYDTHFPSEEKKMRLNLFKKGCILHYKDKPFKTIYSKYRVVSDPSYQHDLPSILDLSLQNISKSFFHNTVFTSMREFAKSFRGRFNIKNEQVEGVPIEFSPIMERLTLLTGSRSRYSFFLNYLSTKFNEKELNLIADNFLSIADQWYELWCLVMKAFYTSGIDGKGLDLMYEKIMNIADNEEKAYNSLVKMSSTSLIRTSSQLIS